MFTTVTLSELSPLPSSSNLIQSLGLHPSFRAHPATLYKRIPSFSPCNCINQRKNKRRQSLQKTDSSLNLRWFLSPKETVDGGDGDKAENRETGAEGTRAVQGAILAGVLVIGVIGGLGAVGYAYKEPINVFLTNFSDFIEGYGAAGYALFVAVYAGLEVLAIPAIPLTMSAGLLFGSVTGTIVVSIGGTIAASVAFLIARYFARERFLKLVEGNKKFLAIDKAIGQNSFKVVTLLRLSPLLPFSLGNYLYGLTSVEFVPYVLGSWLGMLPGTWAYVTAGAFGRAVIQEGSGFRLPEGNGEFFTIGLGLLATGLAAFYVTKLAKDAIKDIE